MAYSNFFIDNKHLTEEEFAKSFIEKLDQLKDLSILEKAKELGVSERTFHRYIAKYAAHLKRHYEKPIQAHLRVTDQIRKEARSNPNDDNFFMLAAQISEVAREDLSHNNKLLSHSARKYFASDFCALICEEMGVNYDAMYEKLEREFNQKKQKTKGFNKEMIQKGSEIAKTRKYLDNQHSNISGQELLIANAKANALVKPNMGNFNKGVVKSDPNFVITKGKDGKERFTYITNGD
ncbi:MAG: helix-turn-helix domain-containing protein [Firmicutes bacterium]|nr:helix-turn-helix domain-containing protein [Bacillota bacterium]